MKQLNEIKVSVCVVTYNQEKYLAECLESLVTQETNFPFEIIVGEDYSSDNTRMILQKFFEEYPNLIVPIFHDKNIGALENIRQVYAKAKGKYIAHLDGDDFALPGKLQEQYNIMEQGYALCSHNVYSINKSGTLNHNFWHFDGGDYDWRFYLKNMPFFAHSSKMFVRNHLDELINNMKSNTYDFELHLESLRFGKIHHLNKNLGVYRLDVGLMANDSSILIKMIDTKIRVYNKSIIYFNDVKFIKKLYLIELLKMLKLCLVEQNFSQIGKILSEILSILVRSK